jgi:hypothetical protein
VKTAWAGRGDIEREYKQREKKGVTAMAKKRNSTWRKPKPAVRSYEDDQKFTQGLTELERFRAEAMGHGCDVAAEALSCASRVGRVLIGLGHTDGEVDRDEVARIAYPIYHDLCQVESPSTALAVATTVFRMLVRSENAPGIDELAATQPTASVIEMPRKEESV